MRKQRHNCAMTPQNRSKPFEISSGYFETLFFDENPHERVSIIRVALPKSKPILNSATPRSQLTVKTRRWNPASKHSCETSRSTMLLKGRSQQHTGIEVPQWQAGKLWIPSSGQVVELSTGRLWFCLTRINRPARRSLIQKNGPENTLLQYKKHNALRRH